MARKMSHAVFARRVHRFEEIEARFGTGQKAGFQLTLRIFVSGHAVEDNTRTHSHAALQVARLRGPVQGQRPNGNGEAEVAATGGVGVGRGDSLVFAGPFSRARRPTLIT